MNRIILGSLLLATLTLTSAFAGAVTFGTTVVASTPSTGPTMSLATAMEENDKTEVFAEEAIFHLSNVEIISPSERMKVFLKLKRPVDKGLSDLEILSQLLEEQN